MAHFARLDSDNIVTDVIVINDSDSGGGTLDTENTGITFCQNHVGDNISVWKQTSYSGQFRGNYAGIGFTYMTGVRTLGVASTDIFVDQQPFSSWSIGVSTSRWFSPLGDAPAVTTEQFNNGQGYLWDEVAYQADNNVGWALTTLTDMTPSPYG